MTAELESWSGAVVTRSDAPTIDCPGAGPSALSSKRGSRSNVAGEHSSFVLRARGADGQQVMNGLSLRMSPGLPATLKGVPRCPDAAANAGSCSEGSRVGTATVGVGPGSNPYYVQEAYLTGPTRGRRSAWRSRPRGRGSVQPRDGGRASEVRRRSRDAQVSRSDPLPTILEGPIRMRAVKVNDRPAGLRLEPDVVRAKSIAGGVGSPGGAVSVRTSPWCDQLCVAGVEAEAQGRVDGQGEMTDGKHPGVKATLTQEPNQANLKKVRVKLPLSLALDPENAQGLCEFEDGTKAEPRCPRGRSWAGEGDDAVLDGAALRAGVLRQERAQRSEVGAADPDDAEAGDPAGGRERGQAEVDGQEHGREGASWSTRSRRSGCAGERFELSIGGGKAASWSTTATSAGASRWPSDRDRWSEQQDQRPQHHAGHPRAAGNPVVGEGLIGETARAGSASRRASTARKE